MFSTFGLTEILIILVIILILFGGPKLLGELGKAARETRKALKDPGLAEAVGEVRQAAAEVGQAVQMATVDIYTETADPLRIFVCSMQDELQAEREAIKAGLQPLTQSGLTRPILFDFENYTSSLDTSEEHMQYLMARSELAIFIIAEGISAPVVMEHSLALEKERPCLYFLKSVEQRSEEAQRFIDSISVAWSVFSTPEELAAKVHNALVLDLLVNWRQRRLAHTDLVALIALGRQLQIKPEVLERAEAQERESRVFSEHPWEPEMLYIPPGNFWMGSDEGDSDAWDNEKPRQRLYLPGYWIGRYPVTNAQYRQFLLANPDHKAPYGWDGREFPAGKADHPVVYVSWSDALAYCRWLSQATRKAYTLPSEAEWEKAARGPGGRRYPWGNEWRDDLANTYAYWGKRSDKDKATTTPVGQFSPGGDSPYGCADMSGNVWEWTRSLYKDYPYRSDDGREDLQVEDDALRVLRGGSFGSVRGSARCAHRDWDFPDVGDTNRGFRAGVVPLPLGSGGSGPLGL